MTTLTQSELALLRKQAESAIAGEWNITFQPQPVLALLDHIAQLTAERDEAIEQTGKTEKSFAGLNSLYQAGLRAQDKAKARIATLEAALAAREAAQ